MPSRLACIADLVPNGARIADVGTDHGLLPVYLLEHGIAVSAVATDIRPGPLARAEDLMRRRQQADSMSCRLCDGLAGVESWEADTVIIAGMGGENIAAILGRAPWTAAGTLLLLQPMSRSEYLRKALSELHIAVTGERLVENAGRIYPVLIARGGGCDFGTQAELYTGRYELVSGEALFGRLLKNTLDKCDAALAGLERSARPEDEAKRGYWRLVRRQLKEMEERYHGDCGGDSGIS